MDKDINDDYSISKSYQTDEFPPYYRQFLVEDYALQETFVIECLQKVYNSGRISGTKLLDFGCGPTVHRIASASLLFNDIVLSEWSESNRKEVEKWLHEDKDALDWRPLLEQCARAEGCRNIDIGVAEIERRIRAAVKTVVPCDTLSKQILPENLGEFDSIITNYCLECCCFTDDAYKEAIRKLAKYLKKDGTIVMTMALEAETYDAGPTKSLPAFRLTEEIIKEAITEAGFELKDWFCWKDTGTYKKFKYGGVVVCFAVKL